MSTDDVGCRGQEAQGSGGRGDIECHFCHEEDILKNMPRVSLEMKINVSLVV